jgi:hypothetical protein
MTVHWYLAKYERDLRRMEPRNVGVVLFYQGRQSSQFLHWRDAKRTLGAPPDSYKSWLHYWRTRLGDGFTTPLLERRVGDNYYMTWGGELLAGNPMPEAAMLMKLFAELVL